MSACWSSSEVARHLFTSASKYASYDFHLPSMAVRSNTGKIRGTPEWPNLNGNPGDPASVNLLAASGAGADRRLPVMLGPLRRNREPAAEGRWSGRSWAGVEPRARLGAEQGTAPAKW